jgi:hypothetical protein
MPFTFSHPAIVLPLAPLSGRRLSLTGLVAGSLAPDFEYFLRMKMQGSFSHTPAGLFCFDLPLGILLAFVFHNVVRDSLIDNLPAFLRSRFSAFQCFGWNGYLKRNWPAVLASVLIGAFSHLLWDAFTHGNGYFVAAMPALAKRVSLWGWQVPVFNALQHLSTIAGAMIVAFAVYRLPANRAGTKGGNAQYWIIATGAALAIIAMRFFCGSGLRRYGDFIVICISAGLASLVIASLLTGKRLNRHALEMKERRKG